MPRITIRNASPGRALGVGILLACMALAVPSAAQAEPNPLDKAARPQYHGPQLELPTRLQGDGLVVDLEGFDPKTTDVTGRITLGEAAYPFTGRYADPARLDGSFRANGNDFEFTLKGDDQRGYTFTTGESSYTLTTAAPSVQPAPSPGAPAGSWSGMLTEQDDFGQAVECPMTITFAEGSHGGHAADVVVEAQMTDDWGRAIDVRAAGRFVGAIENGRGTLRADETTVTVRQTGESATMGPQQMHITVSGDSISGRLGNELEGYSEFRVQKDEATRAAPRRGAPDAKPAALAAPGQVTLNPVTLTDPQMSGAPSHTLLVPEGWQKTGGVKWNPPQLYQDMVHLDLHVTAPDGAAFGYYPGGNYTWSDIFQINAQMGVPGSGPPPQPGQITSEGLTFMPMPQSTGDFVQSMLMPSQRPNATDVRVTNAQEMPEVIATMREILGPTIQSIERQSQTMRQMSGGQMQMSPFADRVTVTYREGGQRFEEDVFVTGYVIITQMPVGMGSVATMARWGVEDMRTVRSPAGGSPNRAIADAASLSVRPDPKWLATVIDMRAQIQKSVMDGINERNRITRQAMEESFKRHQETVRERQASNDRLHHQFINYIRDVEDYRTPSGNVVQLPNQYNNAYMNGQGQVIMTNQTLGSGTGWTQLNRVRP
ncbi:MAG: hypothetical protein RIB60_03810 [Phycisphaerales bacterium]